MKAQTKQADIAEGLAVATAKYYRRVLDSARGRDMWPWQDESTTAFALNRAGECLQEQVRSLFAHPYGGRASQAAYNARTRFSNDAEEGMQKLRKHLGLKDATKQCNELDTEVQTKLRTDFNLEMYCSDYEWALTRMLHTAATEIGCSLSLVVSAMETLDYLKDKKGCDKIQLLLQQLRVDSTT